MRPDPTAGADEGARGRAGGVGCWPWSCAWKSYPLPIVGAGVPVLAPPVLEVSEELAGSLPVCRGQTRNEHVVERVSLSPQVEPT